MSEDLIPHSDAEEGATIVAVTPEPIESNHKSAPKANTNFVTPVTNGTTVVETKAKNKIKSIEADNKTIDSGSIITYTVKLDEKNPDALEGDLKKIRFGFWLQDKNNKHVPLEVGKATLTAHKTHKGAIRIVKKGSLEVEDSTKDFFAIKGQQNLTSNIKNFSYYYALITVDSENKKVTLQVKFSKWLDGYRVRTEAYLLGDKMKADGGETTASRKVKAKPEIIEAYWLNASGRKITHAGYKQDAYLYIKTLGLYGKTIEAQVFDKDIHPNPVPQTGTDDQVSWQNNKIKIEKREVIKQFKVGDKKRYKEAQKDEAAEESPFLGLYSFESKRTYDLELYIHIVNADALKIEGIKSTYGHLNLIPEEKVVTAFFAETETEKVQADASEVKDAKTKKTKLPPKAKVSYYKKLSNGVIGQKIQLVAECTNLDGKEILFKIYEKNKLLVEKDKELPVLQKDAEVTKVKATVTDGYAVAEIELRQKSDDAFKNWLTALNIGGKPKDRKKTYFWIEIEIKDLIIPLKKDFLRRNAFEVISTNWHEPVDDPQISIYNQHGFEKAKSNTFGTGRGRFHSGLDIFSIEGSNVYACLDAEVYEIQKWTSKVKSGYGHNITLKVKNPQELRNRRREYTKAFSTDLDEKSSFDENSDIFLLRYAHLEDILVKKGQFVEAGKVIGKSGVSGIALGTYDPHVHFNIYSTAKAERYLVNPAYYVYWKELKDLTTEDKKVQKDRKDEKYKPNPVPKLSKL